MSARRGWLLLGLWISAVACARNVHEEQREQSAQVAPSAASDVGVAQVAASVSSSASVVAGEDFGAEARILFRVAACGDAPRDVPPGMDAGIVNAHCKELRREYQNYRTAWLSPAMPFFAALRPAALPSRIVYPFGGGDLVAALAVFPDAEEITTISLEPAGDIRPILSLGPAELRRDLEATRAHLARHLEVTFSSTLNLGNEARAQLPGEIVFCLAALAIHGFEPTSLRYFTINADGTLRYPGAEEIAPAGRTSPVLDNMELTFARPGDAGHPRVLRHISHNLDDAHLRKDGALLEHLSIKGDVAAMTKAASHLLWSDDFSLVRSYLLEHATWMISDSTGIPPRIARTAGLVQDTYGLFDGPASYGRIDERDAADLRRLFETNSQRRLSFRFGYPDVNGHAHIVVTRRTPP